MSKKILGYDPYVPADRWSDIAHERIANFDELLRRSDILTVHAPLTDETRHLVSRREIALMKPTAILVNVARGGIFDEAAMFDALQEGRLFGAGIDVWEGVEPPPLDHPLLSLPNVIASPHAAGGTRETQAKSSLAVAEQLLHVLNGGEPFNRVV